MNGLDEKELGPVASFVVTIMATPGLIVLGLGIILGILLIIPAVVIGVGMRQIIGHRITNRPVVEDEDDDG